MKKLLALVLALLALFSLCACGENAADKAIEIADAVITTIVENTESEDESNSVEESQSESENVKEDIAEPAYVLPEEGGYYYDVENVVLYLEVYERLPDNYVTKDEAADAGWSGGSVEKYIEDAAIGGDRFSNREKLIPTEDKYTECDIDTHGESSRGAKRLVFSDSGRYFYTGDHYESFTELYVTQDYEVLEK